MSIELHASKIFEAAPFIHDVSVTIDMSRVTPRVRTLATKLVASRRFDTYTRSQSGVLALAVFHAIAPKGTAYMINSATLYNVTPSAEQIERYGELVRAANAMSRMGDKNAHRYRPVEEIVEHAVKEFVTTGYVRFLSNAMRPHRDALVTELLAPDPDVTHRMAQYILNETKTLVTFTMEKKQWTR